MTALALVPAPELVDDRDRSWTLAAGCRETGPTQFEPTGTLTSLEKDRLRAAAHTWCGPCPVRAACSGYADAGREMGTWGGVLRWWGNNQYRTLDLLSAPVTAVCERPSAGGVERHRARGEEPCRECRAAAAAKALRRYRARRDAEAVAV